MSRYLLVFLLVLGAMIALACARGGAPTQPAVPDLSAQAGNPENHVAWGVFDLVFDLESGTAQIVWNRQAEAHLNVTGAITPPKCETCISVVDFSYNPATLKFYVQMAFVNPTAFTGYDVRGVITNPGGQKFLLNPDGMTSVWGSPMQFRAINVDPERTFGAYEVHGRMFEFYFPPGEKWHALTYIIDASYPGYTDEPLIENGYSDAVVNNGFSTTFLRARIWDHQGDLNPESIIADLMTFGGSPQTKMFDDGQHNDGAPGDWIYGSASFTAPTYVSIGVHMVNVMAFDTSGHMGWGQIPVPVQQTTGGPNDDPIIQNITTDRTTANGAQNEKVKITVDAIDPNGDPLGYNFQASSGTFQGQNGNYIFWKPSSSTTGAQTITVTVVDDKGGQASQQGKLWSTNLAVIQGSTGGMIPEGTLPSIHPAATLHMATDFMGEVCYINIWATWCPYCVQEMPDLTGVFNKFSGNPGYNQIFLNLQESEAEAMNFINSHDYACTYWAMDNSGSYFEQLRGFNGGSGGIPQHFLFDRDGRCRYSKIGAFTGGTSQLEAAISQLL